MILTSNAEYGWPPRMTTRLACAYCGCSRWSLYRAIAAGELAAIAKRGRFQVFAREDLDRWMLGEKAGEVTPITPAKPAGAIRAREATNVDVLARLRAIKAGGR